MSATGLLKVEVIYLTFGEKNKLKDFSSPGEALTDGSSDWHTLQFGSGKQNGR
jgi:hypothetical protein